MTMYAFSSYNNGTITNIFKIKLLPYNGTEQLKYIMVYNILYLVYIYNSTYYIRYGYGVSTELSRQLRPGLEPDLFSPAPALDHSSETFHTQHPSHPRTGFKRIQTQGWKKWMLWPKLCAWFSSMLSCQVSR